MSTNLSKISNSKGKILILSYDQGLEVGPSCLDEFSANYQNIFNLVNSSKFTGIALQKGFAELYSEKYRLRKFISSDHKPLIVKLNGKTPLNPSNINSAANCSFDYAMRLGATGIGYTIYPGSKDESKQFREAGIIQELCRDAKVPFILWSYAKSQDGSFSEFDPKIIAHAARVGSELGADVIKLKYPKFANGTDSEMLEILNDIVKIAYPKKVVFAGGSKIGEDEFLRNASIVEKSMAAGMVIGRNVWGSPKCKFVADTLCEIFKK